MTDEAVQTNTEEPEFHPELPYIIDLVEPGSSVLDLGCGEGDLMKALQTQKRARVQGIELSDTAIQECVAKGLFVYHGDLDEGLADFNDKSVDYVILTSTIQVLHRPDFLVLEAARVGKMCIITFPNFGYWNVRLQLLLKGKMPTTSRLPYKWYNSPNIHLATIKDFREFCKEFGLTIVKEMHFALGKNGARRIKHWPNFLADYAVFMLKGK